MTDDTEFNHLTFEQWSRITPHNASYEVSVRDLDWLRYCTLMDLHFSPTAEPHGYWLD